MAESEDEYSFPDDFKDLDFDNIPGLQAPPPVSIHASQSSAPLAVPLNMVPSGVASPAPSVGSSSVEEMDASFLAAVDALEDRALCEIHRGSETSSRAKPDDATKVVSGSPQSEVLNQEREHSFQSIEASSVNRKGKRKAESLDERDVQAFLAAYETELTCPICCDLLIGAHMTNPCGHTCCGECGYGWLARNKCEPTCAVCRTELAARNPLLPNFSVDNLVRQHLQALARSGRPEWQAKGYKTIEWNKRLESWNKQVVARTAKEKSKDTARLRRHPPRYEYTFTDPWLIDDNMDEYENAVASRVVLRRTTRSRR